MYRVVLWTFLHPLWLLSSLLSSCFPSLLSFLSPLPIFLLSLTLPPFLPPPTPPPLVLLQSLCGVSSTCPQQHNPAHSRTGSNGNRNGGGPRCMDTGRLPACPSWCHPWCLHTWRAAHRYMKLFSKLILLRSRNCGKNNSLEVVFFSKLLLSYTAQNIAI